MKKKRYILSLLLALALSVNAFAMEIPTDTLVQNLNGSQQFIKPYTLPPDADPQKLIAEPFELDGFPYTFADIVKKENRVEDHKYHIEQVTVETETNSLQVIEKVHALLRSALNQAVTWGYISINPANSVTLPKYKPQPREVWFPEQAQQALDLCTDAILRLAMLLALGCSTRIGEILGLTWDCVDISETSMEQGTACVCINKELKRCQKQSLTDLERRGHSDVIFIFPEKKQTGSTTSLVLKSSKTDSSVRTVYLPDTVSYALRDMKASQDELKGLLGGAYKDFDLVLAHEDGRPCEERQIAEKLRKFIQENSLSPVVFHSLRHCSTSVKLQISGGNVKAIQGDTGHAQARMVTDLYAHTNNEARRQLAQKVEADFFQHRDPSVKDKENAVADEALAAYQLLQANPDIAKLIIAMMQKSGTA